MQLRAKNCKVYALSCRVQIKRCAIVYLLNWDINIALLTFELNVNYIKKSTPLKRLTEMLSYFTNCKCRSPLRQEIYTILH